MTTPELEGRVAIVTGASAGLGATVASELARRGATVVVFDIAEPSWSLPANVRWVRTDVADEASIDAGVADVVARHGRVDVLVNCAAIWFRRPFLEITADEWDRVNAINLRGPFLLTRAVAPVMQAGGGGAVVNVASQAGVQFTRGQGAHYAASKAGLVQLTRVLSYELGAAGIRVNAVAPGRIVDSNEADDERVGGLPDDARASIDRIRNQTPLGRFVTAGEVAETIVFLCLPQSAGLTGQTLVVNGGALGYV
mgnify:CR=1 FL=1